MIDLTKLTDSQIIDMAPEITFHNILGWRREELLRIIDGERATHVIPESNQRSKLMRDGVLMSIYRRGGKEIIVTPKARILLEEQL